MRVIFLDFDGVLNSHHWQITRPHPNLVFDPMAVDRLNRLLAITDAKIVVSSSWRHGRTVEQLAGILEGYGLHTLMNRSWAGRIADKTPDVGDFPERGYEVKAWLDANSWVSEFVIFDDGNDFPVHGDRLILTKMEYGLLDEHIDKALELFGIDTREIA